MLKLGIIKYLNVYPVYEFLLENCDFCNFVFDEPSKLNLMLRNGKIDISPSSSIEYLRYKDNYELVENFSISSRQKVMSVILALNKEINKIEENDIIYLSPSSSTSNALLKIIFFEFFKVMPKFSEFEYNDFKNLNQLLIGDNALKLYLQKEKISNFYVYDLAEIWYNYTKLPFVFALWIGNKENLKKKKEFLEVFKKILRKANRSYKIPQKYKDFKKEEIELYFQNIDYEFNDKHKKSLNLFFELLKKWNLI